MSKIIMLSGLVALLSLNAISFAGEGFDAEKSACADMQAALKNDGTVTIHTWLGSNTYYASPSACTGEDEIAIPAYEFSQDTLMCKVGYSCRSHLAR